MGLFQSQFEDMRWCVLLLLVGVFAQKNGKRKELAKKLGKSQKKGKYSSLK